MQTLEQFQKNQDNLDRGSQRASVYSRVRLGSPAVSSINSFAPFEMFNVISVEPSTDYVAGSYYSETRLQTSFWGRQEFISALELFDAHDIAENTGQGTPVQPIDTFRVLAYCDETRLADRDYTNRAVTVSGRASTLSALEERNTPISGDVRVHLAEGVATWAADAGLTAEVTNVAGMLLKHVPQAHRVLVTTTQDPDDGQAGLRFTVFTQASVEAVVNAEDDLHQALSIQTAPSKTTSFSIAYDFV